MKAAASFTLALVVPYGMAFVQLGSVGNAVRRHGNLDDRQLSRVASSNRHEAEAQAALDSQTLSEVSSDLLKGLVGYQQCVAGGLIHASVHGYLR